MDAPATLPTPQGTLRPALSGALATLSGNGLARFSYVSLFPALVTAGWVTGAEAGLLGALNLAGYLAGVLGGRPLAVRLGTAGALNFGMGLVTLSFLACAWHAGLGWLAAWRFAAGAAGGILMGLAGPAVLGVVAPSRRGVAGGLVIMGVGAGIMLSSVAVPLLLGSGVASTWLGLAALAALFWAVAAASWPKGEIVLPSAPSPTALHLYAAYGLSAAGLVPHMVYFADFVVRGRSLSTEEAALAWFLFGSGGIAGPLIGGRVADAWGGAVAVRAALVVQVAALAVVFLPGRPPLFAAAVLGGLAAVGISAATLARSREIAGPAAGAVWVRATAAFAIAQAATGFGYAWLFASTRSHEALFAVALGLSVAALVPDLLAARGPRPNDQRRPGGGTDG